MKTSVERFSNRVQNYVKYRPTYPPQVLTTLKTHCGLNTTSLIADVGSGTGILTEIFLKNGNTVLGVEPNREMREAAEHLLQSYPSFHSIAATAEATTLAPQSVDFISVGQAFHWFNREATKPEFQRILRPKGWVILVWNERRLASTGFLREYEQILNTYGTDYQQVNHRQVDEVALAEFYGASGYHSRTFPTQQIFDYEGVKGRMLSSSYTPDTTHPQYQQMLKALQAGFRKHQVNGTISFDYDTHLYYGQIG